MKKIIAAFMAVILIIGTVGCSSEPKISETFKDDKELLENVFEVMDEFLNGPASADDAAKKLDSMENKFSDSSLRIIVGSLSSNLTIYAMYERGHERNPDIYTSEEIRELFDNIKESVQELKDLVYK